MCTKRNYRCITENVYQTRRWIFAKSSINLRRFDDVRQTRRGNYVRLFGYFISNNEKEDALSRRPNDNAKEKNRRSRRLIIKMKIKKILRD